jgi:cation transport ATPase
VDCFLPAGPPPAADGAFNGLWAAATVQGARYTLGPPEDVPELPEVARLLHEGGYLLALGREDEGQPLGFVALQPRLSPGVAELTQLCQRHGVRLELLAADSRAAQAVARRAAVPLLPATDPVAVIRERQQTGARVVFVSDSAQAAPAFADCDLAVGLLWEQPRRFPARADLLASDLSGVAAIVEAGARRERAVRDGVLLSALGNVAGALWGLRGGPGVENASRVVYLAALGALADGWVRLRGGG